MRHLLSFVLVALLPAALPASEPSPEPPEPKYQTPEERIDVLFDAMRRGVYEQTAFPSLGWEHIPALLERAVGKAQLRGFPRRVLFR